LSTADKIQYKWFLTMRIYPQFTHRWLLESIGVWSAVGYWRWLGRWLCFCHGASMISKQKSVKHWKAIDSFTKLYIVINIVHTLIIFCCMLSSSHEKNVYWYFVLLKVIYLYFYFWPVWLLSVLLRYTNSDYPFGIFKFFLYEIWFRK
jgi:hypothetical protein